MQKSMTVAGKVVVTICLKESINASLVGCVGGMMGYLATAKGSIDRNIRRAMIYGSVVASFCCEGFGLNRTTGIKRSHINARVKELEKLTRF